MENIKKRIVEKGNAMVIVMAMIAIIAGLAMAYITVSTAQQKQADSSIDDMSYYQTAWSGLEIARGYLLNKYTADTSGWDTELTKSINNYTTYTSSANSITPGNLYTLGYQSWFQWCRNIDYYGNTYFSRIENNNDGGGISNDIDGVLKLTVYGWGGGNITSQRSQEILLESMIRYKTDPYQPTSAVVVGGSLQISGNASIGGTNGSIQANGAVTLTGSANVSGNVTSTSSISAPPGSIGGSSNSFSTKTNIPSISPTAYSSLATYILKSTGTVYDTSTGMSYAPPYLGWSWSDNMWKYTSSTANDGSYFAETDVSISGSPGSPSDPWELTLLATGYIDVGGTPSIQPFTGGIALMAGTDLKMRGGGGNVYGVGLYAAHEQVSLRGTPNINGTLLAEDYQDISSLVSTTSDVDVDIGGSSNITYNGNLTTVLIDGYPYIQILGFKKRTKIKY